MNTPPPIDTPRVGLKRRAIVQPYQGTLNQQYEQALGLQPRYVAQNPGSQRLNTMYDQALGYTGGMRRRG